MKRAVIISGGKIQTDFALAFLRTQIWDYVIGADKGVIFCHKNQIKFQEGRQFVQLLTKCRQVIWGHSENRDVNVTAGAVVPPGSGAEQHDTLCPEPSSDGSYFSIQVFHGSVHEISS